MKVFFEKINSGYALITALWIVVVMIILSTALIATSSKTLFLVSNYKARKQVTTLAESGMNEAIAHLISDRTWGTNGAASIPDSITPEPLKNLPSNISYYVTFNTSDKFYSVNNLNGSTSKVGYNGRLIPPYSANIICYAKVDGTSRIVDVFLQPASDVKSPLLVENDISINLANGFGMHTGLFSLESENSGQADIHSNKNISIISNDVNLHLNKISSSGVISLSDTNPNGALLNSSSRIDVPVPPETSQLAQVQNTVINLPRGTYTKINDNSYSFHDPYGVNPDITISANNVPGVSVKDGVLIISENQLVAGQITVDGSLKFEDGAYLQITNDNDYSKWASGNNQAEALGNLVVNGTIGGNGSVMAERNVTFDVTKTDNESRNKINIIAGDTVTLFSNSDSPAEFSGYIHAGNLIADNITDSNGNLKDLKIYGGIFVAQNTLNPLPDFVAQNIQLKSAPMPTETPDPTTKYIKKSAKAMKMMAAPAANAPVITDGTVTINASNLYLIYDEDYLNLSNSKQSYRKYNIASWTEYTK